MVRDHQDVIEGNGYIIEGYSGIAGLDLVSMVFHGLHVVCFISSCP